MMLFLLYLWHYEHLCLNFSHSSQMILALEAYPWLCRETHSNADLNLTQQSVVLKDHTPVLNHRCHGLDIRLFEREVTVFDPICKDETPEPGEKKAKYETNRTFEFIIDDIAPVSSVCYCICSYDMHFHITITILLT